MNSTFKKISYKARRKMVIRNTNSRVDVKYPKELHRLHSAHSRKSSEAGAK